MLLLQDVEKLWFWMCLR